MLRLGARSSINLTRQAVENSFATQSGQKRTWSERSQRSASGPLEDVAGIPMGCPQLCSVQLIPRSGEGVLDDLMVIAGQLRWPELEGQLVDLAGEAERQLIVLVVDWRAGVDAHVECFVDGYQEWSGVRDLLGRDFSAVHPQDAGAALAEARSIVLEVKHDGVPARRERLLAFPAEAFKTNEVVGKHWLALKQVQAIAAEAAADGDDHPFARVLRAARKSDGGAGAARNFYVSSDRIRPVQDARCIALGQAGHLARVSEDGPPCRGTWPWRNDAWQDGVVEWEHVVLRGLYQE